MIKPQYICDKWNLPMNTIREVGYLGNPNGSEEEFECSPFTELICLCPTCTPVDFLLPKESSKKTNEN